MSLFAIQHSGMVHRPFKHRWARFIPAIFERSYVLCAGLTLMLLFRLWRSMPALIRPSLAAACILVGVMREKWDLLGVFGDEYRRARRRASMRFERRNLN
jgi:protein-S-isoprenylcysteine O-methyltransferase Ste14